MLPMFSLQVLYILIFIHMKMTLEELAQQVQALGTQLHNAAKSIVDSQLLGSCLSKGSRGAGRTGGPKDGAMIWFDQCQIMG